MKWPNFLHVDINSHKLKVTQKNFVQACSKMGRANLVSEL